MFFFHLKSAHSKFIELFYLIRRGRYARTRDKVSISPTFYSWSFYESFARCFFTRTFGAIQIKCHQMTQRGEKEFAKLSRDIFSKKIEPNSSILACFKRMLGHYFWKILMSHHNGGGGGCMSQCHKMIQGGGGGGSKKKQKIFT